MNTDSFRTPGQLIKALLAERGWTQQLLAIILNVYDADISNIISGKKPISAEMAISLAEVFEVSAEIFLDLQKEYDLAKAHLIIKPNPGRAITAKLLGDLPIAEMIRRRWLNVEDMRDISAVETALMKFFHAESINEIEILPHASKKTNTTIPITPAQLAWIYRVKEIASEMIVGRYSPSSVKEAIPKIRNLLMSPEEARKVPRMLTECGIRFVIVESLSGTKVDGVCLWLNDFAPVIGITLRYDRIDNFWFVLRHELEHVKLRHGQPAMMVDAELEGERAGTGPDIPEEERLANKAAQDFCVPQKRMDSFIERKSPFFHERDILGLANTLQIHPGLVAGQLQYRTGRYDLFRQHLTKIRHIILPNAMVDGWGDVAPVGL